MVLTEYKDTSMTFHLDNIEHERYKEFQAHHCGIIELIFTPIGIGTKVEVRCCGCKVREDISDYDTW